MKKALVGLGIVLAIPLLVFLVQGIAAESGEVVTTLLSTREVRPRRGESVRLEFDMSPRSCPVELRICWDERPVESALVGTPVADPKSPVEILRTVHSLDPCIACAVHVIDPDNDRAYTVRVC